MGIKDFTSSSYLIFESLYNRGRWSAEARVLNQLPEVTWLTQLVGLTLHKATSCNRQNGLCVFLQVSHHSSTPSSGVRYNMRAVEKNSVLPIASV